MNIGDSVAYSVQFLESIGMSHSGLARARGKIEKIEALGSITIAYIDWKDPDIPLKVNVKNLAKVGLNMRFSNC